MSRALIGVLALHLVSACGNATGAKQGPDYGRIPLGFEQNRGQTDASVKFLARGGDHYIFITGRRQSEVDNAVNRIGKNVTGV